MSTVQVYQYMVLNLDDGRSVKAGSLSEARSITIDNDVVTDETFSVAPETAVKIFDAAGAMGSFSVLWLECDFDLSIQFTTGSTHFDVKTLTGTGTAGMMGPALVLGADDTLVGGTQNTFNGTAGTIGQIWASNPDATNTARVRIVCAN